MDVTCIVVFTIDPCKSKRLLDDIVSMLRQATVREHLISDPSEWTAARLSGEPVERSPC